VAHGKACASSTADPTTCECDCGGRYHGSDWRPDTADAPDVRAVPSRKRKVRRVVAVAVAVTVTGTVAGLAATGEFSASSNASSDLSVQVNVDLNKTIAALSSLGFGGRPISTSGNAGYSNRTDCGKAATGRLQKFFTHHPCERYDAERWTITRQDSIAQVAFSWVEMSTSSLASQYKVEVDTYGAGNPPGVSSAFNGRCYASDQQGSIVWTVEVRPTGNMKIDQGVLQDAAQRSLSPDYLRKHCVI
jgi:hypothetical protein